MDHITQNQSDRLQSEQRDLRIYLDGPKEEMDKYPAKQHARLVATQLNVSNGLIYLPGQPSQTQEDSDQARPFRQRRYFFYLSGVNEPDCALTYDIDADSLTLYIPPPDYGKVIWSGKGLTLEAAMAAYDVDEVRRSGTLSDTTCLLRHDINTWVSSTRGLSTIYCLHRSQEPFQGSLINSTLLQAVMDRARVCKDTHEIQLIRKANDITASAHRDVLRSISKLKTESEIQATFLDTCVSEGAKHQAYGIIAASGENNSILHYERDDQTLAGKQLVLLDAGCEWKCYASDVTRTFPLSGFWPSPEARAIYDLVDSMQRSCIERLRPGVRYLDLHFLAQEIAINGLLRLGILHGGTAEDIFHAGTILAFFPHGLGHHIGLEVHDVCWQDLYDVSQEQNTSSYPRSHGFAMILGEYCKAPCTEESPLLEEGMVVTVEPGIYFSRYALNHKYLLSPKHSRYINQDVLERYFPVGGVRIEDDVLITHNGFENLTTAPKGEQMLRIIQGSDSEPKG